MSSQELINVAEKERDSGVATQADLENLKEVITLTEVSSDGLNYTLASSGGDITGLLEDVVYAVEFETPSNDVTINIKVDDLAYIPMVEADGGAPVAGTILGASGSYPYTVMELTYDGVNNEFRLVNGSASLRSIDYFLKKSEAGALAYLDTVEIGDDTISNAKLSEADELSFGRYGTTTGTDAYLFTTSDPNLSTSSYREGDQWRTIFPNTNTVTNPTINVDGLGVKNLIDEFGAALSVGYIGTSKYLTLTYDLSNDAIRVERETLSVPSATTTNEGIVELATQAEIDAGTDAVRVPTAETLQQKIDDNVIGVNQAWTDVTASRSSGVIYTNSTGKTIQCYILLSSGTFDASAVQVRINSGSAWIGVGAEGGSSAMSSHFLVPNGHEYRVNGASITIWTELR